MEKVQIFLKNNQTKFYNCLLGHFNLISCFTGENLKSIGLVGRHINKNINRSQDKSSGKQLNFVKGVWSLLNKSSFATINKCQS